MGFEGLGAYKGRPDVRSGIAEASPGLFRLTNQHRSQTMQTAVRQFPGERQSVTWIRPLQILDDESAVCHHIVAMLDVGQLQGNARLLTDIKSHCRLARSEPWAQQHSRGALKLKYDHHALSLQPTPVMLGKYIPSCATTRLHTLRLWVCYKPCPTNPLSSDCI